MGVALTAVLISLGAVEVTIQDDFESGQLSTSWANVGVMFPAETSMSTVTAAAHRGDGGLRIVDGHGGSGVGAEAWLAFYPGLLPGDYFSRGWVRMSSQTDAGQDYLVQLESVGATDINELGFDFNPLGGGLKTGGFDGLGNFDLYAVAPVPNDGAWHLFEADLLGLSSDAGARQLFWDGVKLDDSALDLTGQLMTQFNIGEVYGDLDFTGTLDFDDVRTSLVRPATFISVEGQPPDAGTVGDCIGLSVVLHDVLGNQAPAPYDVSAAVTLNGVSGQLFSDACLTPVTGLTVLQDASAASLWLRADAPGVASIAASHRDFLPQGAKQLVIAARPVDAGSPDAGAADAGAADAGAPDAGSEGPGLLPPLWLNLGCGCSDASGGLAWLVFLTALQSFRMRPARRR